MTAQVTLSTCHIQIKIGTMFCDTIIPVSIVVIGVAELVLFLSCDIFGVLQYGTCARKHYVNAGTEMCDKAISKYYIHILCVTYIKRFPDPL
jgi:hypothetical protein